MIQPADSAGPSVRGKLLEAAAAWVWQELQNVGASHNWPYAPLLTLPQVSFHDQKGNIQQAPLKTKQAENVSAFTRMAHQHFHASWPTCFYKQSALKAD